MLVVSFIYPISSGGHAWIFQGFREHFDTSCWACWDILDDYEHFDIIGIIDIIDYYLCMAFIYDTYVCITIHSCSICIFLLIRGLLYVHEYK